MVMSLTASPMDLDFGQWLLLRRREIGLTQAKLAEALGIKPQSVSNWERGFSKPELSIEQIKILCTALKCDVWDMPNGETKNDSTNQNP